MKVVYWLLLGSKENSNKVLVFYEELEEYFLAYNKSDESYENFGKKALFALCKYSDGLKKEVYMPFLEKLLSLNISLDVTDRGRTPLKVSKGSGAWAIYERLNLSQMKESLKGNLSGLCLQLSLAMCIYPLI